MSLQVKFQWPIKRYARFINNKDEPMENETNWMVVYIPFNLPNHIISENSDLVLLYLQTECLIIMKSNVIEESLPLANSQSTIRAVTKGDSILIATKLENSVKRFRVQFDGFNEKNGKEQCEEFVKIFCQFFPIKSTLPNKKSDLSGTVSLDSIVEAIEGNIEFPSVYMNPLTSLESNDLQCLIYTCLFDPTFPKFIADVDKAFKNIIEN
ncbi:uncharacterized protein LOC111617784 isoform X2 [Centruroides sculpturatus]|uniref:uncharacterized protein LOC111617784 isoform X2 n=1 Tax=Centruroides sculpturatus TaxID=218467 RepID=UPI000C6EFB90|nr:uncharacterized protein LOC111617784 isoform X2 [Centruroides sculpturatus]